MSTDPRHRPAVTAVGRLLGPLIPLLLELGVGVGEFEDLIRRLYVEAALPLARRTSRKGAKQSIVRTRAPPEKVPIASIAMLTGLTRALVARVLATGELREGPTAMGRHRAERVLTAWQHDPEFRDDRTGAAAVLPMRGAQRSFTALVKRHSGDPRVRTLLHELLRVRAVRRHRDGRLELIRTTYAPNHFNAEALAVIGEQARDHLQTLVGNVKKPALALYARHVVNTHLDPAEVGKLLRDIALQADATMESIDAAINDPSATLTSHESARRGTRLGAAFFVFQDPVTDAPSGTAKKSSRPARPPQTRRSPRRSR